MSVKCKDLWSHEIINEIEIVERYPFIGPLRRRGQKGFSVYERSSTVIVKKTFECIACKHTGPEEDFVGAKKETSTNVH